MRLNRKQVLALLLLTAALSAVLAARLAFP
jgi:hypothetical protein